MKAFLILKINLTILLLASVASGNDVIIKGSIAVSAKHIEITVVNESSNAIFIKDFWQSFSQGEFIRFSKGKDGEKMLSSESGLINDDVFNRGRYWINIPPKSDNKDGISYIKNYVKLRIPISEILQSSLLQGDSSDRLNIYLTYAIMGVRVPAIGDWKSLKVSFKFPEKDLNGSK